MISTSIWQFRAFFIGLLTFLISCRGERGQLNQRVDSTTSSLAFIKKNNSFQRHLRRSNIVAAILFSNEFFALASLPVRTTKVIFTPFFGQKLKKNLSIFFIIHLFVKCLIHYWSCRRRLWCSLISPWLKRLHLTASLEKMTRFQL